MRTQAFVKNSTAEHGKHFIMRNLALITNTRSLDFGKRSGQLSSLYTDKGSLKKGGQKLQRLGRLRDQMKIYGRPITRSMGLYGNTR